MEYAKFTPLPKTDEEIIEEHATHKTRQDNIQKFVDDNDLIKLKCDYFGMDSYYYDKNNKTMYKVSNIITMSDKSTIPKFEVSCDSHILEINNITEGFEGFSEPRSVGFMEHSGVNPRSQVDVTELCSVKSTCDGSDQT